MSMAWIPNGLLTPMSILNDPLGLYRGIKIREGKKEEEEKAHTPYSPRVLSKMVGVCARWLTNTSVYAKLARLKLCDSLNKASFLSILVDGSVMATSISLDNDKRVRV